MKHTITMKDVQARIKNGVSTFSRKDNSPRGCSTVSASEVKIGDEIVIDNYFTTIVEDSEEFDYAGDLFAENDYLKKEIAKFKRENARLERKLSETKKFKAELDLENSDLKAQNENLFAQVCYLSSDNSMFEDEVAELNGKISTLENDNANLISDLQDYEIENAELIAENEVLQNKVTKLEIKSDELQTQLHQYQALFADIESNITVSLYQSLLGAFGRQGVQV